MSIMNAKFLEEKLKQGWGIEDFCNKLNVLEADFFQLLERSFKSRAVKDFTRRLTLNSKKNVKANKKKEKGREIMKKENSELETLLTEQQHIRDYIFGIESKIQDLKEEKSECKEVLRKAKKTLEEFLIRLKTEEDRINKFAESMEQIDSEIKLEQSKLTQARQELETVRSEIERIRNLTIILKKDGGIQVFDENQDSVDIPENLDTEKFLEHLIGLDYLEDLSIKELRTVAQLLAIGEYLQKDSDLKVKFSFEELSNISAAIEILEEFAN